MVVEQAFYKPLSDALWSKEPWGGGRGKLALSEFIPHRP